MARDFVEKQATVEQRSASRYEKKPARGGEGGGKEGPRRIKEQNRNNGTGGENRPRGARLKERTWSQDLKELRGEGLKSGESAGRGARNKKKAGRGNYIIDKKKFSGGGDRALIRPLQRPGGGGGVGSLLGYFAGPERWVFAVRDQNTENKEQTGPRFAVPIRVSQGEIRHRRVHLKK